MKTIIISINILLMCIFLIDWIRWHWLCKVSSSAITCKHKVDSICSWNHSWLNIIDEQLYSRGELTFVYYSFFQHISNTGNKHIFSCFLRNCFYSNQVYWTEERPKKYHKNMYIHTENIFTWFFFSTKVIARGNF